jgi:hypothetical protein
MFARQIEHILIRHMRRAEMPQQISCSSYTCSCARITTASSDEVPHVFDQFLGIEPVEISFECAYWQSDMPNHECLQRPLPRSRPHPATGPARSIPNDVNVAINFHES